MFSEQSKVQIEQQESRQSRPPGNPRWVKGVSGNPAGAESKAARRARIDALVSEWSEPVGGVGALKPVEVALLRRAAELYLYSKPKTIEEQSRIANTIGRLVAQSGLANARKAADRGPVHKPLRETLLRGS
jgi:hypothetical protein